MDSPHPLNQTSTAHSHGALDPPPPYHKRRLPSPTASIIYSRDFAYADNAPMIVRPAPMAATDITNANARTFAEVKELYEEAVQMGECSGEHVAETLCERLLSGPMVEFYVGPERKHWSLHLNLLRHQSSYFELDLDGHEDVSKKLELLDSDPVGFELLVKWLYQGILEPASHFDTDEAKYEHAVACHKLWLLCDKFEMLRLKNMAVDTYRRCLHDSQLVPDADEIHDIYQSSPVGSPFRSLMIKIAARQVMDPDVQRGAEAYKKCFESDPNFAIGLVNAIRQLSGGMLFRDPTQGDFCAYHDHSDGSACAMQGKGKTRAPQTRGEESTAEVAAGTSVAVVAHVANTPKRTPRKLRTPSKTSSKNEKHNTSPSKPRPPAIETGQADHPVSLRKPDEGVCASTKLIVTGTPATCPGNSHGGTPLLEVIPCQMVSTASLDNNVYNTPHGDAQTFGGATPASAKTGRGGENTEPYAEANSGRTVNSDRPRRTPRKLLRAKSTRAGDTSDTHCDPHLLLQGATRSRRVSSLIMRFDGSSGVAVA